MYSMPNDMHDGKLPDGVEERFPYHVYVNRGTVAAKYLTEPGGISLAIYFPDEKLVEWLAHNITGKYEYRKHIGERSNPTRNPSMEPVYCFENENDAIAFKLRWVGAES